MKSPTDHTHVRLLSLKWLLLSAFVLSLFPLPLGRAKPADAPYPCMHCACGCSSADQCWQSCCCFNDEQKLAWAEKNGVTPPAWFLEKMSREKTVASKACCSKCSAKSCCDKGPAAEAAKSSCKESKPSDSREVAQPRTKNGFRWLVLDDALRCKGSFVTLDKGIPKLPSIIPVLSFSIEAYKLTIVPGELLLSVGLLPPTPPPRG